MDAVAGSDEPRTSIACPRCGRPARLVDILAFGSGRALLEYRCEIDGGFETPSVGDPKIESWFHSDPEPPESRRDW